MGFRVFVKDENVILFKWSSKSTVNGENSGILEPKKRHWSLKATKGHWNVLHGLVLLSTHQITFTLQCKMRIRGWRMRRADEIRCWSREGDDEVPNSSYCKTWVSNTSSQFIGSQFWSRGTFVGSHDCVKNTSDQAQGWYGLFFRCWWMPQGCI